MDILTEALKLPQHEMKLLMADAAVLKWMEDPVNREYLKQRKREYLHTKGWSVNKGKNFKCEAVVPSDAHMHLPKEWKLDPKGKEFMRWIKDRHPYLLLNSL